MQLVRPQVHRQLERLDLPGERLLSGRAEVLVALKGIGSTEGDDALGPRLYALDLAKRILQYFSACHSLSLASKSAMVLLRSTSAALDIMIECVACAE